MELNKKVLIFPAGTEIALEMFNALKYSKFVTLYGGTSVVDHSEFVYKNLITGFPYVTEPGFIDYLNGVIRQHDIDCVYPAHDSACLFLSEHASEIDAQVIMTDMNTTRICRSKKETYSYLAGENYIPKHFDTIDQVNDYPVFVKPTVGEGSKGARRIDKQEDLVYALSEDPSLLICEYLPGMEYTVDCFTDSKGALRIAKLRDRERIRTGISVRSKELPMEPDVMDIAVSLNKRLHFRGAWFFQLKKNIKGDYRLMEASPRIPGTVGASRNMGINYPLLTLFDYWGYDVNIIENEYNLMVDRAFYSAYKIDCEYEHVYLDFDDTMIVKGSVNRLMMAFLYQCVDNKKHVHLLSKHSTDLYLDLKRYKIEPTLFDDIVVIGQEENKIDYIKEFPAIFIDDSYAERSRIKDKYNIPVFDVDMIESLIDWKF